MIKAYLKNEWTDWDLPLKCRSQSVCTFHVAARHLKSKDHLKSSYTKNETVTSYNEYGDKIRERLQSAHSLAGKYIEK